VLKPVFQRYNQMVAHLAELEAAKRQHAESLKTEVLHASAALLEQQADLARSEKLATVGELAAGMAHELRNPLAGIQMSCANLQRELEDPDKVARMSLVIEELARMTRLLNELLDLGKHTPAPIEEIALYRLIDPLMALLRYQIPAHIRLHQDIPLDLRALLPASRIRQCLMNLILNAAEALGTGPGTIEVTARALDEDHLELVVRDDGPGFDPAFLKNGIRPFATGKTKGTGIGLVMVLRFVRELGGQLTLDQNTPKGARVTLKLPWIKA
jgi:signal transduction histidine kinase